MAFGRRARGLKQPSNTKTRKETEECPQFRDRQEQIPLEERQAATGENPRNDVNVKRARRGGFWDKAGLAMMTFMTVCASDEENAFCVHNKR